MVNAVNVGKDNDYQKLSDDDMETLLAEAKYRFSQGLEPDKSSFNTANILYSSLLDSFAGETVSKKVDIIVDRINTGMKRMDDEIDKGAVRKGLRTRHRLEEFYDDIKQTLNDILVINVSGMVVFIHKEQVLGRYNFGRFGRGMLHELTTYDETFRSFIIQKIIEHFPESEVPSLLRLVIDRRNDLITRSREDVVTNYDTVPFDLVYPGLPEPKIFWDNFSKATGRVTLLQGEGGTCKSTYLQHILNYRGWDKVYIADNESVIARDDFVDFIRSSIPNGGVLIIEDGDRILTKREDGNTLMSAILNALSGIATKDIRIFITVNLKKLNNVDEALMRSGRMYRLLKFNRLPLENARKLREYLGDDPNDLTEANGYTAGDVFNFNENNEKMESHRNTLGFV